MNKDCMNGFNHYNKALISDDFATVFETMADDINYLQQGSHTLSEVMEGKQALGAHLAKLTEKSNGTLKVITNWVSSNGCFVAVNVTFVAEQANGNILDMNGIDNGQIQELRLFSAIQAVDANSRE